MLDFEENTRHLEQLKNKIKELGESLWHHFFEKWTRQFRAKNKWTRFLGWYTNFY